MIEQRGLRAAIDDIANQICACVDGDFDFAVRSASEDETLEKLTMLINFVLEAARRGMSALRDHNAALAELDRAKTAFFSNVSHELRTPLTLILGPLEDALAGSFGEPSPALREQLAISHRNALRLLKLVNAMLDFMRIEAGRVDAHFEAVDLAELTIDLASSFRSAVERAGLALRVECSPLPQPVFVDRAALEKIILNLLSNALKFTFTGEIAVTLRDAGGQAEIAIADTGVGIPTDEQARVFERFHRVVGTQSRSHEGTGIGLSLVRELVAMHGGTIALESEPQRGSTFRIAIPYGNTHLPAESLAGRARSDSVRAAFVEEAMRWLPEDTAVSSSDGERVLVVDDNADMRAYVARLLGTRWRVELAADGATALAKARRDPPQLVLTDVMMAGLDGFALLRALRDDERTRTIPVIMLSARAGQESKIEGLDAGADDYLVKPFTARELVARVASQLALSKERRQIERERAAMLAKVQAESHYNEVLYRVASALATEVDTDKMMQLIIDAATSVTGAVQTRYEPAFRETQPVRRDTYLAIPIVGAAGEVHGGLVCTGARFTDDHERLVAGIATQAALALERAKLYAELRVSEERARAAYDRARQADQRKDEFLAMLGHELRNPLAPILTAVQMMAQRSGSDSSREEQVIERQVHHMMGLVDDLLDIARITRGKVELHKKPTDIAAIVGRAVEMASPLLEQRAHHLELEVERELWVDGDPVRLAQVLANLLTNAAKYTDRGGRVHMRAWRQADRVRVAVRDNGRGISADLLPHVFDIFVQGKRAADRAEGGLGIGLTLVRRLTEMHGGSVTAESEGIGRGSQFVVELPASAPPSTLPVERVSEPSITTARARVLLVDDNEDAAEMLAEALRVDRHEVHVAHDGPSAIDLARTFDATAAIVDIGLPVMDGYELAHRLRELWGERSVLLVALTGYGQDSDKARSRAAGFDAHLVKPVDLAVVSRLLRERA